MSIGKSCRFDKSHVNVRLWHEAAGGPKTNEGSFWSETWTWARVIASRLRPDGLAGPSRRRNALRGATARANARTWRSNLSLTPEHLDTLTEHLNPLTP